MPLRSRGGVAIVSADVSTVTGAAEITEWVRDIATVSMDGYYMFDSAKVQQLMVDRCVGRQEIARASSLRVETIRRITAGQRVRARSVEPFLRALFSFEPLAFKIANENTAPAELARTA